MIRQLEAEKVAAPTLGSLDKSHLERFPAREIFENERYIRVEGRQRTAIMSGAQTAPNEPIRR